jgi:Methylamine utilisation protein MauE
MARPPPRPFGTFSGRVWWDGLAIVLLAAALLKAHQAVTKPVSPPGLLGSPPVLICLVWLEVLLGCWILAGLYRQATRRIVVASFGLFAVAALALALEGSESCGCFGRVRVNPWYTFAFDAAMALAVCLVPGSGLASRTIGDAPGRLMTAGAAALCLGGGATWAIMAHGPTVLEVGGTVLQGSSLIALKPEVWEGKPFPLVPFIQLDAPEVHLSEGRWLAVLFQHDCSHCRSVVPELWDWAAGQTGAHAAFIEMPPYAPTGKSLLEAAPSHSGRVAVGKLSDRQKWFAQTPVLIELEDGIVRRAEAGDIDPRSWQGGQGHGARRFRPPSLSETPLGPGAGRDASSHVPLTSDLVPKRPNCLPKSRKHWWNSSTGSV